MTEKSPPDDWPLPTPQEAVKSPELMRRLLASGGGRGGAGGGGDPAGAPGTDVDTVGRGDDGFLDAVSGAADRIIGLGLAQPAVTGGRTAEAVVRQLQAMGCSRYEIDVRGPAVTTSLSVSLTAEEVLQRVPWLLRMNAQGNDILVRPAEPEHALALVDDLTSGGVQAMKRAGHAPAAVVETSPQRFQAWVKTAAAAGRQLLFRIARRLAREHDGAAASADSRQFGRLAGFANCAPEHTTRSGLRPRAALVEASGQIAPRGAQLLLDAETELNRRTAMTEKSPPDDWPPPASALVKTAAGC